MRCWFWTGRNFRHTSSSGKTANNVINVAGFDHAIEMALYCRLWRLTKPPTPGLTQGGLSDFVSPMRNTTIPILKVKCCQNNIYLFLYLLLHYYHFNLYVKMTESARHHSDNCMNLATIHWIWPTVLLFRALFPWQTTLPTSLLSGLQSLPFL